MGGMKRHKMTLDMDNTTKGLVKHVHSFATSVSAPSDSDQRSVLQKFGFGDTKQRGDKSTDDPSGGGGE